jgi:hypothetical protein
MQIYTVLTQDTSTISIYKIYKFVMIQILCFWTLSIILSLSRNTVVFIFQNNVSETGFCLRLQVKPTQLGPIDRASPEIRISSIYRQDDG